MYDEFVGIYLQKFEIQYVNYNIILRNFHHYCIVYKL